MSRPGNLQRAAWRRKCRATLAAYLESQLGLSIDPALVRLNPDIQDGYKWSSLPEKADKALSKLSIGPLKELCREVGKSFKAVAPQAADQSSNSTEASFSSVVEHLTREKTRIQEELIQWQKTAKEEGESRRNLEARYHEMQLSLSIAHEKADRFKDENDRLRIRLRNLNNKLGRSQQQTNKVVRALQTWRQTVLTESDDEDMT